MKTEPIINGKKLNCLTDFRWSTVRVYVKSDYAKDRDSGVAAVFAFAAIGLCVTLADEKELHADIAKLHDAAITAGCLLTDDEAQQISDYINSKLGLTEAASVETPEGKQ